MVRKAFLTIIAVLFTGIFLGIPQESQAVVINLLVDGSSYGPTALVDYAIFTQGSPGVSGTGVFDSFVRISTNDDLEEGYNSSVRPLVFDENTSPTWTKSLTLNQVTTTTVGGVLYREFFLDINQQKKPNGTNNEFLLSLDQLKIYLSPTEVDPNPTNLSLLGTKIYDLDNGDGDSTIYLDYRFEPGSGQADMAALIPDSIFTGNNPYVYLYSQFGSVYPNNDGFEEWAVRKVAGTTVIPEPASLSLFGLGLLGLLGLKKRS